MESRGEEGGKRRDKEIVQEIATYFPGEAHTIPLNSDLLAV